MPLDRMSRPVIRPIAPHRAASRHPPPARGANGVDAEAPNPRNQRIGRPTNTSKLRLNKPESLFFIHMCVYTSSTHVKENHGANIFGVAFNTLLGKEEPQVFATAGSNRVTVYECPRQGGMQLLHCYADPDVS